MREITASEIWKLRECLQVLSEYHNEVSVNFKGVFPKKPYDETLAEFEKELESQKAFIVAAESESNVVGFCKVSIHGQYGNLDYLVVKKEYRGKGLGTELMDWAMRKFEASDVQHIEVKVIDGNPAIHLYENYGFKMKSHILGIEK